MLAYITAVMVGGLHAATDLKKYRNGSAVEWLFWALMAVIQIIPGYQEAEQADFAVQSTAGAWLDFLWNTLFRHVIFQVVLLYLRHSIILEQLLRGYSYTKLDEHVLAFDEPGEHVVDDQSSWPINDNV